MPKKSRTQTAPISRVTRSKSDARKTYNGLSRWYDALAGSSEKRYTDMALQALDARTGEVLLEIGFGTGHGIQALAQSVGETGKVYGIDLSSKMLELTRKRINEAGLSNRVALLCGDAVELPYASQKFDAILISFTLELFDTPEIPLVLRECLRVLRNDGRLSVVSLSKGNNGPAVRVYERLHRVFPRFLDCRPIYLRQAVEEAGFEVDDWKEFSMFGLPGESVLARKMN